MKLGSLFDGSGGFPLAGAICGIEPVWASEVEPYPIAVTRSRFPNMIHLGNVMKINGAEIEPVDVLTFGFPCQDVSVAGKRKSVKHKDKGDEETTRSGLFWETVRIIEEMRCATNGKYPRFAVFENVLGLFSAKREKRFARSLKVSLKSSSRQPLCLTFRRKDGHTQTVTSETDGVLLTEFSTLNTSERLNGEEGCTLSSILEVNVPGKYYLSSTACEGILRRAERRGKELPPMLKEALEQMIERERATASR